MRTIITAVLAIIAMSASVAGHADEAFESAFRKCRAIDNPEARLTCYDAVASMAPESDPAAPTQEVAGGQSAAEPDPGHQISSTVVAGTAAVAGASVVDSPASTESAATETAAEPEVQPLTDDVGMERVDPSKQVNPEYSARVINCDKNPQSGQTYFFLDNDQVWKQANYRRISLGKCEFDVRLSKDAFGYELYIPSKDRTIRVTRIR